METHWDESGDPRRDSFACPGGGLVGCIGIPVDIGARIRYNFYM